MPQVGDYVVFNLSGIQLVGRVSSHLSVGEMGIDSVILEYNSRLLIETVHNCRPVQPPPIHIEAVSPRKFSHRDIP